MQLLSQEVERTLVTTIQQQVKSYFEELREHEKKANNSLGLMSRKRACEELQITTQTIKEWERLGLKRWTPPLENSRTIFYKTADILAFLQAK